MTVSISDILEEVRTTITSCTNANVNLGTPVDSKPGLYLFAYKLSEVPMSNAIEASSDRRYSLQFLLMANPSSDYVVLDKGLKCLIESQIWASDERKVVITMNWLSTDELALIFESAGISLRLAIPFELKWTVS